MKKIYILYLFAFGFMACNKPTDEPLVFKPTIEDHYLFGNPSNAGMSSSIDADNFMIKRRQYVVSYNQTRATANWVSWHLSKDWLGTATRQNDFRPDPDLPSAFYKVVTYDYNDSGFDRGHLCPSADRTLNDEDNSATFYTTNIIPQSPNINRNNWEKLESYCRKVVKEGNEMYIIAGVIGEGGTGSNGGRTKKVDGKITVPSMVWKIVLIIPYGEDDLNRVDKNTRVIATIFPNMQSQGDTPWGDLRTSVDEIEDLTGYDFFENISNSLEKTLEAKVDAGETE